ncbi:MAG: hypothetical protein BWY98_00156 [Tenericutes bacterium ADurb.BinA155]|nr:MAG: hypothetical protein BWY98_00156 [Tenericutes bacterium ADurb.BinA155]
MKAKDWFLDFGKGAALGTGILPGVSVGTVGIIVGIYDKLLNTINDLRKHFGKAFLTLLPIALGCIIVAVFLLWGYDKVKPYAGFEIVALFAGAILGGIPVILYELKKGKPTKGDILRVVIGFIVAAGIGVLSVIAKIYWGFDLSGAFLNPNQNWWVYPVTFIVGFVAAVACILPGISGSMVLFICGLYDPVVGLYIGADSMFKNHDRVLTGLILTLVLLVGVVIGLFVVSKAMTKLMEKHHQGTFTVVLGFVLGSIVSMFVNNQIWESYGVLEWWHYLLGGIAFLVAAVLLFFLITHAHKKAEKTDTDKAVSVSKVDD